MNTIFLTRFISASLVTAVIAGVWDGWWHGAVGRDTLWEPPHLLLYFAAFFAIIAGIYGWHKTREKVWRRVAMLLALIPLSAPFDELWHRMFGVENLSSPLVLWSPPHLTIILVSVASLAMLLPLIQKDPDIHAKRLFGAVTFAGILGLLIFVLGPIEPTGPWKLLGFWGAGVIAFIFAGTILIAHRWIAGIGSATLTISFFFLIIGVGVIETVASNIVISPHDHPPFWLMIFSFLIPAVLVDLLIKSSLWLRGALVGILWSAILYGFSSSFFEPEFHYSIIQTFEAVFASGIGGIMAGTLVSRYVKNNP